MNSATMPRKADKKRWANEFGMSSKAVEVFQTAAKMIHERGFHATSMNELAEAVNLTKPGLYYYIGGKEELLFRIMNFAMNQLENLVVNPAMEEPDAEKRLRIIIRNHAMMVTTGLGEISVLVDEISGLAGENLQIVVTRKRQYLDFIRAILGDLQKEGKLREIDLTVATFSLLGMILWLARWFDTKGNLSNDQVAEEVVNIITGGLFKHD